jgi:flagellar biogenesis protein FliO
MISARSKILVVEALGKRYLVGATQERIQLLADLDFFADGNEGESDDADFNQALAPQTKKIVKTMATEAAISSQATHAKPVQQNRASVSQQPIVTARPTQQTSGTAEKIREKLKTLKKLSP